VALRCVAVRATDTASTAMRGSVVAGIAFIPPRVLRHVARERVSSRGARGEARAKRRRGQELFERMAESHSRLAEASVVGG
jgi:hypothetical protein